MINKTGALLDALKKIRQIIREAKQEPNVITTVDFVAMQAIHDFFKVNYPIQEIKDEEECPDCDGTGTTPTNGMTCSHVPCPTCYDKVNKRLGIKDEKK